MARPPTPGVVWTLLSARTVFRLVDSNGSVFYSRNGQFKLDENRNLVNMQGLQLTGYPATGTPPTIQQGANPTNISIPNTLMAAKTTTTASMQINLNSSDSLPLLTHLMPAMRIAITKRFGDCFR